MATSKLSQQVLDAVYVRLSNPSNGYNVGIQAQAALYGLPTNYAVLDFSASSRNFYFDQIDVDLMDQSSTITYPFGCLYILELQQTNEQKFTKVSGLVRCIFEVNLSWQKVGGIQNREIYSSCIEDVVVDIINRVDNQNWMTPLVYNGLIQCKRGPTVFGLEHYKKKIGFSMIFGYDQ